MADQVGNLSDAALKRKERLAQIKQKLAGESEGPGVSEEDSESLPKPIFRSYQPQDESLKENVLPKAKPVSVDEQIKDHLEGVNPEPLIDEVNLVSLAPRKPDWDLKRDVTKKLEKLERRTQRAIIALIKERLMSNEENGSADNIDLADAVNFVEKSQSRDSDED